MSLSENPIDPRDRLIFALDVPTIDDARAWVERLGDSVTFYKLGLEFCMGGRYFELLEELVAGGKKVFADLKFSDVPATVRGAVANLARSGATCCTLHGTSCVYRDVVKVRGAMKLLAVTVLTSCGPEDVAEMGWSGPVEDLVSLRARKAIEAGIDGLICSGQEAARLRRELGSSPLIITPGIRAAEEKGGDDQKRTMTLEEAFLAGADHIVVGRPIRNAPDPRAAAEAMRAQIAALFS
ncbi:MAG: orotidine-5'-phosphate decarboxylase [Chthoniobacteraceae bacterium]